MTTTQVKERPMLFSGPMVRAILDGRKTQTRRIVKPQPSHRLIEGMGHVTVGMDPADDGAVWYDADCINPGREVRCPYGRIGDRLWVRETWGYVGGDEYLYQRDQGSVAYRASHAALHHSPGGRWRPSIHMPRWASRLTLEITDIRVERLNEISEADALEDGGWDYANCPLHKSPIRSFVDLWESINGPESWAANPCVWVISFKKLEAVR